MKRKWTRIAAVMALVSIFVVTSVFAYFTDKDKQTNTFTIGDVAIDLKEENWDALPRSEDTNNDGKITNDDIPNEAKHMYPTQEIEKDPSVVNQGSNSAWVYLQVTVPKAEVIAADKDGNRLNGGKAASTQLYEYRADDTEWQLLKENKQAVNANVYLYGVKAPVASGNQTVPLFENVTLVNLIEGQLDPNSIQMIDIKAFAIQSDNTGTNMEAWSKYVNQAEDEVKNSILVK
ncbi:MAG: SipW-dependent-type signal peptide-containing protein [Clostridiales bacterium]|nr:SipW-dependent-type signal peptide-containing protein [Clostridiales bacterium]